MKKDLDLLQGAWIVAALELDGEAMPESMLQAARITVKGNRFTTTGMGADYKGTLEIDESAQPRRLDMKFNSGPEKGATNLAIYRLADDLWTLCIATRGDKRPSKFKTTIGTGIALETLRREGVLGVVKKPERQKSKTLLAGSSDVVTEFEGEWNMVSGVMDGKVMEASVVQWVRRITLGKETKVTAGPQTILQVEFTHDATTSPKSIDYVLTVGPHKGKTQLGIYELESDLLKVCMASPGAKRPGEFQSVARDGRTFTTWRRAG